MRWPNDPSHLVVLEGWSDQKRNEAVSWVRQGADRHVLVITNDHPVSMDRRIYFTGESEAELKRLAFHYLFLPITSESQKFKEIYDEVQGCAADYADFGRTLVSNIQANLQHQFSFATDFFGRFSGKTAVICGGGPSLEKNGRWLADIGDKALVLSTGSGGEILRRLGITPHAAVHVDPDPSHAFLKEIPFNYPLFFLLRTSKDVVRQSKGLKFLIPSAQNFPLETWAEKKLGLQGSPFDGGWTAGTYGIALAASLGCSRIITLGVDLSHEKQDRVLSARWLGDFAKNHPEIVLMNGAEVLTGSGPIAFEGARQVSGGKIAEEISASITRCTLRNDKIMRQLEQDISFIPDMPVDVAHDQIFKPLWKIWKHPIARQNELGSEAVDIYQYFLAKDVYKAIS
jgi:hypothetical protein